MHGIRSIELKKKETFSKWSLAQLFVTCICRSVWMYYMYVSIYISSHVMNRHHLYRAEIVKIIIIEEKKKPTHSHTHLVMTVKYLSSVNKKFEWAKKIITHVLHGMYVHICSIIMPNTHTIQQNCAKYLCINYLLLNKWITRKL